MKSSNILQIYYICINNSGSFISTTFRDFNISEAMKMKNTGMLHKRDGSKLE